MAKFNRDKAIIRLRKAAEAAKSWPHGREIHAICDRMDRELEEQRNFDAMMKIGK